ncbi:hypothetical protein Cpir12675_002756 [Ceratocystis pirilliformis]|uniref:AB hydrolase-1 domain-containing protein n=1 Tax=Ceratocystis pirilliformis TaxID=259994 RepID=A0ABR3Z8I0_9PEZI
MSMPVSLSSILASTHSLPSESIGVLPTGSSSAIVVTEQYVPSPGPGPGLAPSSEPASLVGTPAFIDPQSPLPLPAAPAPAPAPAPTPAAASSRRRLLIVYIHGFYGNDESFRAFPELVHNHLREQLRETHIIYSKIYPRYKTYRAIEVGRDIFSDWLAPHVTDGQTDVVLVGHSMGGILAAEVALMTTPVVSPSVRPRLKHRILGIIALDTPFLGLHPRIIVSGISSLFTTTPAPEPFSPPEPPASTAPSTPQRTDTSIFNPSFINDVHLKARPFTKSIAHFAKKHKPTGLLAATKMHVISHLEYVGCLVDQRSLKARYARISALADVDVFQNAAAAADAEKVGFVNYFTACHGRRKKLSSAERRLVLAGPGSEGQRNRDRDINDWLPASAFARRHMSDANLSAARDPHGWPLSDRHSQAHAEDISGSNNTLGSSALGDWPPNEYLEPESGRLLAPPPPYGTRNFAVSADAIDTFSRASPASSAAGSTTSLASILDVLPAGAHELCAISSAGSTVSGTSSGDSSFYSTATSGSTCTFTTSHTTGQQQKPPRERKFCLLPEPLPDSWVRVYVEDVDEVGAHCGIFLPGSHYEALVGDVAERITGWIEEDLSRREVIRLSMEG